MRNYSRYKIQKMNGGSKYRMVLQPDRLNSCVFNRASRVGAVVLPYTSHSALVPRMQFDAAHDAPGKHPGKSA
jgi:hypothetical protein